MSNRPRNHEYPFHERRQGQGFTPPAPKRRPLSWGEVIFWTLFYGLGTAALIVLGFHVLRGLLAVIDHLGAVQ